MNLTRHIPKSIIKLHSKILPVTSHGSYVYTSDNKYLDFTSGIGALSTGHNHPLVKNRVIKQLNKYVHLPQQVFQSHPIQLELTEKIIQTTPAELNSIFYTNSGSEATENAIKIARKHTGKSNIIAMCGGFHGRTLGALSVTSSNTNCRRGVTPLVPNIYFCNEFTKESLHKIIQYQSPTNDTAAIILESIQGEAGVHSIPIDFLEYIERICRDNNIMLIADEVQCGSMRTGVWWNIIDKGVTPDIMTFGKGIASGYPLAGVLSSIDIMDNLSQGSLGGTYGGNAVSSAAAVATIDILQTPEIYEHINYMGSYINNVLRQEQTIKEVRQYGLMIAIEFYTLHASSIVKLLREQNILVLLSGSKSQYIRILPPLNVSLIEIDQFLDVFTSILRSCDLG